MRYDRFNVKFGLIGSVTIDPQIPVTLIDLDKNPDSPLNF